VNLRSLRYVLKSRGGAALNVRLSVPQKTAAAPVSHAPEKISINTGRERPASENTHTGAIKSPSSYGISASTCMRSLSFTPYYGFFLYMDAMKITVV
jgi:hypothetical protein